MADGTELRTAPGELRSVLTKAFMGKVKLDVNYFRRFVNNYADDDQIDNTTISFPIAFRKSIIYGAESKLEVPDWHRFSCYVSYSYTVGNAWFPVTGGLFLGDDAAAAETRRRRRRSSPDTFRIRKTSAIPFADADATRRTRDSGWQQAFNMTPASPSNSTAILQRSSLSMDRVC
jgi:hypothetical protein